LPPVIVRFGWAVAVSARPASTMINACMRTMLSPQGV
jgi:hypothetical protein